MYNLEHQIHVLPVILVVARGQKRFFLFSQSGIQVNLHFVFDSSIFIILFQIMSCCKWKHKVVVFFLKQLKEQGLIKYLTSYWVGLEYLWKASFPQGLLCRVRGGKGGYESCDAQNAQRPFLQRMALKDHPRLEGQTTCGHVGSLGCNKALLRLERGACHICTSENCHAIFNWPLRTRWAHGGMGGILTFLPDKQLRFTHLTGCGEGEFPLCIK